MTRIPYKFLTLGFLLLAFNCHDTGTKNESGTQQDPDNRLMLTKEQFKQNDMALGSIDKKSFPTVVKVTGMIDVPPGNRAVVNSIIGGYIKSTPLLVGDTVKKGQALVTLENPEFVTLQQEYLEIKEQLNYLRSEYDRQKTMLDENITSRKNYLKAESSFKTGRAKYNGLRKRLTMLNISPEIVESGSITSIITIYAPIGGSITKVNVSRGTYVSPSTPIMEIIDNDHIHLELSVFEKDIMKIKKDQKINFKIPEASEDNFEARVYLVGTSIDENRTIKVHGHPLDESNRFLTGMFVNADIITDTATFKALPETAVVEVNQRHYILLLDKVIEDTYYFEQMEVHLGTNSNGYHQIMDNTLLKDTDKILLNGAFNLIGNE
jgi:cobalt-zinc-cadmium efflux system membrane fusion protein